MGLAQIIQHLLDRALFVGIHADTSTLPLHTLLQKGSYALVGDFLYINATAGWRKVSSVVAEDYGFVGTYASTGDLPAIETVATGSYAFVDNRIYYMTGSAWELMIGDFAGTVVSFDLLPSGVPEGTTAYVSNENLMYIYLGSSWIKIPDSNDERLSTYYTNPIGDYFMTITTKRVDDTIKTVYNLYYKPAITLGIEGNGYIIIRLLEEHDVAPDTYIDVDKITTTIRSLDVSYNEANDTIEILLAVNEDTPATAIVGGATANGHIDLEVDGGLGTGGNVYSITIDGATTTIRPFNITHTDNDYTVELEIVEDAAATAIIGGATANGHIDMEVDGGIGVAGNDLTITVDGVTTTLRAMSVEKVGDNITVYLAVVEDTPATAIIGGATANGHIDMEVDGGIGEAGNDLSITVDGDIVTVTNTDRPLSIEKVGDNITVYLKIVGDAKATGTIGVGANSHIDFEAANPGTIYNYDHIQIDGSGGNPDTSEIRALSVEETLGTPGVTVNQLLIKLAVKEDTAASAVIGNPDNDNGHIDVDIVGKGLAGNDYSYIVSIASGLDQPLSVSQDGTKLVIELGTDVNGYVSLTKNTCTLVTAAINGLISGDFAATADGTGAEPLTYSEPETNFSGGANELDDAANTCTLIEAAVNAVATMFVATADGDGSGSIVAWDDDELSGGTNKVDDGGDNTAGNVATEINTAALGITAVADGTGLVDLAAEAQQSFAGGANKIDDGGANSADSIATEINLQAVGVTAVADGTGLVDLAAEALQSFSGGSNKINDDGTNSAGTVATAINNYQSIFVATADGTGLVDLGNEAKIQFENGSNKLDNTQNTDDLITAELELLEKSGEKLCTADSESTGSIDDSCFKQFGFDGEFSRLIEEIYDYLGTSVIKTLITEFTYEDGILISEVVADE